MGERSSPVIKNHRRLSMSRYQKPTGNHKALRVKQRSPLMYNEHAVHLVQNAERDKRS